MEPTAVETTTLWDMLSEPSFSLHLPRFALFLFIALILEIIFSKKKRCLKCSVSTVILQLVTGICGIIGIYFSVTASFYEGDRVPIPVWYYPVIGLFILAVFFTFTNGAKYLLNNRLFSNLIVRSLVFVIAVYFAITTAVTPSRINKSLEVWEKKLPQRQPISSRLNGNEVHIQLSKEHLLNQTSLVEKIEQEIYRQVYALYIDNFEKKVDEGILVEVNDAEEHLLNWEVVSAILTACVKEGFADIAINDFRCHINARGVSSHDRNADTLIIQRNEITQRQDGIYPVGLPLEDQYEWDLIHAWCKRNSGKIATMCFAKNVSLDVLQEVVEIFDSQEVTYYIGKPDESSGPECLWDITLELYLEREHVPNQSSEPTSLNAQN